MEKVLLDDDQEYNVNPVAFDRCYCSILPKKASGNGVSQNVLALGYGVSDLSVSVTVKNRFSDRPRMRTDKTVNY